MSLAWREIAVDGVPKPGREVLLWAPPMSNQAYDVGVWRAEMGGYWSTRGEVRAMRLGSFTHWAYVEGPSL